MIPDRNRAHLVPYNTTYLERDLALRLGIPMYGADPKFFPLGTKTGSRRLFAEAGVPHPLGYGDIHSVPAAVAAICEMRRRKPEIAQVLVKLNEALSGEGNAVVDLQGLPKPAQQRRRPRSRRACAPCVASLQAWATRPSARS